MLQRLYIVKCNETTMPLPSPPDVGDYLIFHNSRALLHRFSAHLAQLTKIGPVVLWTPQPQFSSNSGLILEGNWRVLDLLFENFLLFFSSLLVSVLELCTFFPLLNFRHLKVWYLCQGQASPKFSTHIWFDISQIFSVVSLTLSLPVFPSNSVPSAPGGAEFISHLPCHQLTRRLSLPCFSHFFYLFLLGPGHIQMLLWL